MRAIAAIGCVLVAGCGGEAHAPAPLPATPWKAAAVAHGGVGTGPEHSDGCRAAVDATLAVLERGGDPLDAAVAGVMVMEDDPRFNAGTGSRVRLDGETVQMDAAVMRSDGRFAAVAAVEDVRNPVAVARAILDTPHVLLVGDGATRFARTLGMPHHDVATKEMTEKSAEIREKLRRADPSLPEAWRRFDWRARWNFEKSLAEAGLSPDDGPVPAVGTATAGAGAASPVAGTATAGAATASPGADTVGVAARTADGRFAVALSTGGTGITLRGRVGDVPIYGCGLFAGSHGATAATGEGERIIELALAREVHAWLAAGLSPTEAAERAVAAIKARSAEAAIGLVVVGATGLAAAADRPMAWAGRESGSAEWLGPK